MLTAESTAVATEITSARGRIGELKQVLEETWVGEMRAQYVLTSVFVHRGTTPSFGHYFIYQRRMPEGERLGVDEWYKYNDSDVSIVSADEVLADTTGSTANPYLVSSSFICILIALFVDEIGPPAVGVHAQGRRYHRHCTSRTTNAYRLKGCFPFIS